ncbi:MAG: oligosaccharide flippase family protein [Cyclobacteriaceae bacterium]|nr:oligosaccharide flippase family protein [Cyclobacteriaceae bacterium]
MGIVIRQSFFTTVISYAGIVLGYINVLYLYPRFLDLEQIGLLRTILDFAILMAFFAQAGLATSIIRFYPRFVRDQTESQGFINLVLLIATGSYLIFLLVYFLFEEHFLGFFGENAELLAQYIHLALWLTFVVAISTLMESFARTQLKLAFPRLVNEIGIRFLQGVVVTLYFINIITFHQLLIASVLIYMLSLIIILVYLARIGLFRFSVSVIRIPKPMIREFAFFSIVSLVSTSVFMMIGRLDSLMVSALIDFKANAVYTTAFYMAAAIEVPRRAIAQVNSTLLARAFEKNDLTEVQSLYRKTSINQLIIGALLLIGLWANLHNIYALMPNGDAYRIGFNVVVIVGLAKLIDMTFGPNSEILAMSNYYWVNSLALIFLAPLIIALNYLLIPIYGIDGAAYGSCISILIFNIIKYIYIYAKFRQQPFTYKTIVVLLISGLSIALAYYLPVVDQPIVDLLYRSALITLVFSSLILLTKSSDEINTIVQQALIKVGVIKR